MSDSWMPIQPRIDEPSKPRPSSNVSLVPELDGKRAVLPGSEHVDELQVDHLGLVLLREFEELLGRHRCTSLRLATAGGRPATHACFGGHEHTGSGVPRFQVFRVLVQGSELESSKRWDQNHGTRTGNLEPEPWNPEANSAPRLVRGAPSRAPGRGSARRGRHPATCAAGDTVRGRAGRPDSRRGGTR